MLKRLDSVGVAVKDAAAAVDFYVSKLGFEGQAQGGEGSVSLGDISLYIWESKVPGDAVGRSTDYYSNPVGLDHLAFEVEDIEKASTEFESRGVAFEHDIVGEAGSFRYRGFKDPDGNMLYIIQKA